MKAIFTLFSLLTVFAGLGQNPSIKINVFNPVDSTYAPIFAEITNTSDKYLIIHIPFFNELYDSNGLLVDEKLIPSADIDYSGILIVPSSKVTWFFSRKDFPYPEHYLFYYRHKYTRIEDLFKNDMLREFVDLNPEHHIDEQLLGNLYDNYSADGNSIINKLDEEFLLIPPNKMKAIFIGVYDTNRLTDKMVVKIEKPEMNVYTVYKDTLFIDSIITVFIFPPRNIIPENSRFKKFELPNKIVFDYYGN